MKPQLAEAEIDQRQGRLRRKTPAPVGRGQLEADVGFPFVVRLAAYPAAPDEQTAVFQRDRQLEPAAGVLRRQAMNVFTNDRASCSERSSQG